MPRYRHWSYRSEWANCYHQAVYNLEQEKARTTVIIRSGKSREQRETPFISPPPLTLFLHNLNFSFFLSSKTDYCTYIHGALIRVWLFVTPWTVACQAPLSMGFPSPWDSPGRNTGVELPFPSQESSWPKDQTHVSCTGRWILYRATKEANCEAYIC